jgi:ribosomal protein RSM22 (predicted rRNA methylase)
MKDLIEDISQLKIITIAENTWVNKKLVPVSIKLVELDKVIDLLKRNPVNDFIRDIITDLENLSNGYEALDERHGTKYIINKADLDAYIQQLEDRIL